MPDSKTTVRARVLFVPDELIPDLERAFGKRMWRPVDGLGWSATRVRVTMIPQNRVGGCLLGEWKGEAETGGVETDNALVTAARRAVGKWLNARTESIYYRSAARLADESSMSAKRLRGFIAAGKFAMKNDAGWARPLARRGDDAQRTVPEPDDRNAGARGGFRPREYYALRHSALGTVLVGRGSAYGKVIEENDPHRSPPAPWSISAKFVVPDEPIGKPLEARLRDLEKTAGNFVTHVLALRAVVEGITQDSFRATVLSQGGADAVPESGKGFRKPKIKGKKLGESIMPAVPILRRKLVDNWYVASTKECFA